MLLLANVLLTTTRPTFNTTTLATGPATPYLRGVLAHIGPAKASAYLLLPDATVKSLYQANVETGTDIAVGDLITTITLLDGVTTWPGDNPNTGTPGQDPTSLWVVVFQEESPPGLLAYRQLYVTRYTGEGPTHP
jgi:hypothetical protein